MVYGTVKWFNRDKGFGFISPDGGGKDVFVHQRQVDASRCGELHDGDRVSFEVENDKRSGKPQAVNIAQDH